jgi:hypothetical protein
MIQIEFVADIAKAPFGLEIGSRGAKAVLALDQSGDFGGRDAPTSLECALAATFGGKTALQAGSLWIGVVAGFFVGVAVGDDVLAVFLSPLFHGASAVFGIFLSGPFVDCRHPFRVFLLPLDVARNPLFFMALIGCLLA